MVRRKSKPSNAEEQLHLSSFQQPLEHHGPSLEEISQTLASHPTKELDPYGDPGPSDSASSTLADSESVDDADCPISPRSIFEAMLFIGHPEDKPLSSQQVAKLMRGVRPQEVDELVQELNAFYERENCPYFVDSQESGYVLTLRSEYAPMREVFYGKIRDARLSQVAIDVLAIVAYNQPISRDAVSEFRGEASNRVLSQLVRRELLRVERTDEKPRRTLYFTTERFLTLFGLRSLDELPQSHDFDKR